VLTRLAAGTGEETWSRSHAGVGRADYLGPLTDELVLVGGSEEFRLAEQAPDAKGGPVISAIDAGDGSPEWTWSADKGSVAHVVGIDAEQAVVVERGPGGVRMFALSAAGEEGWSIEPEDAAYEATLRDGVVVMKSASALYGYDAESGDQLWRKPVPTDRTYFPYGFTLGQMPSLDADRVLVPTTTDLVALDVHDGDEVRYALPVDGINTTYWPYQLVATDDLLGVVTNTGAVVARRE
jgi:outer membrane protein assembly factor BamB